MAPAMAHPLSYYAKVAGTCFVLGGLMELFMIKTGFYDKVTEIEAARLEESREEREAFLASLRAELERQAAEKHLSLHIPGSGAACGVQQQRQQQQQRSEQR